MRLGLIGLGAIGRVVAAHTSPVAILTSTGSCEDFLAAQPEVVIEAAGPDALRQYALAILQTGAALIAASGAALRDADFRAEVEATCRKYHTRMYVPSGALAGLDALASAAVGGLDDVTLRVRDPAPAAEFDGNMLDELRQHPGRLNIAMATALAANGPVHLIVTEGRPHEFELTARGAFGDFSATLRPAGVSIVAFSLLATLREHEDRVRRASHRQTDSARG